MDDLSTLEYRAFRDTIRQRGTARLVVAWLALALWAALALVVWVAGIVPAMTLVPLLALAAGFETVAALHINVERIGRYVQVEYEEARAESPGNAEGRRPRWEHAAMAYGRSWPKGGIDPLLSTHFLAATALNLFPAAGALPLELGGLALAHAAMAVRIVALRDRARRQRAEDLERFREVKRQLDQPADSSRPTPRD